MDHFSGKLSSLVTVFGPSASETTNKKGFGGIRPQPAFGLAVGGWCTGSFRSRCPPEPKTLKRRCLFFGCFGRKIDGFRALVEKSMGLDPWFPWWLFFIRGSPSISNLMEHLGPQTLPQNSQTVRDSERKHVSFWGGEANGALGRSTPYTQYPAFFQLV